MSFDVRSQDARRRERGALTASSHVDDTYLGSARRKLVGDSGADDAGADDRDLHVPILDRHRGGVTVARGVPLPIVGVRKAAHERRSSGRSSSQVESDACPGQSLSAVSPSEQNVLPPFCYILRHGAECSADMTMPMPARRGRKAAPAASRISARYPDRGLDAPVGYIRNGGVKLSVRSKGGREVIVATLVAGDFFGEGRLGGQRRRRSTASAMNGTTVETIGKSTMRELLHTRCEFADRFRLHMLKRNIRIERDLVDQLFNSSEKRLARVLLLAAGYGTALDKTLRLPRLSQQTLAEMICTTRSRVSFLLNKFRDLGFIEHGRGITVTPALLAVVLHD